MYRKVRKVVEVQLQVHQLSQSQQTKTTKGRSMLRNPHSVGVVEVGGMSFVSALVRGM